MGDDPMAADALWAFALKVYSGAGVSACCLDLQDSFGADVPVLLTALWMARRGMQLDADGMIDLDRQIGAWRDEMVVPLRALRRRLKAGPLPAPTDETETLRSEIKRAELHAEKIELATLALWVDATFAPTGTPECRGNLSVALAFYSGGAKVPDQLIAPLVAAAEAT